MKNMTWSLNGWIRTKSTLIVDRNVWNPYEKKFHIWMYSYLNNAERQSEMKWTEWNRQQNVYGLFFFFCFVIGIYFVVCDWCCARRNRQNTTHLIPFEQRKRMKIKASTIKKISTFIDLLFFPLSLGNSLSLEYLLYIVSVITLFTVWCLLVLLLHAIFVTRKKNNLWLLLIRCCLLHSNETKKKIIWNEKKRKYHHQ